MTARSPYVRVRAMLLLAWMVCAVALLVAPSANAAVDKLINFQGRLVDPATGQVVADGTYNMEFKLHNHATNTGGAQGSCSGTCLWMETRTAGNRVTVTRGQFSIQLGSVTALPANSTFDQTSLYLSVRIGGTAVSPVWDGEMTPRHRLAPAPSAIFAENAGTATTATTATNSTQLNGQAASYYAVKNANNSFSTSQTVTGTLTATDVSATNGIVANGNINAQGGTLWMGGDARFYRVGADYIRTSGQLTIDGALNLGSGIYFSQANPSISASSYFVAPGGAYFSAGTVYTEASLRARGGVSNDSGANLVLGGGTSGNTLVSGQLLIGAADTGFYRNVADQVRTDDNMYVGSGLGVNGGFLLSGGASINGQVALTTQGSGGGLTFGSTAGGGSTANLYGGNYWGFTALRTDNILWAPSLALDGGITCTDCVDQADLAANAVGADEFKNIANRSNGPNALASGATGAWTATCNAGERAISGGYSTGGNVYLRSSNMSGSNGWYVQVYNASAGAINVTVWVHCLIA